MGSEVLKPDRRNGAALTPNQMERVLLTLSKVIDGLKWKDIAAAGGYSWNEFSWMLAKYPDIGKAYREARANSGQMFEDKALDLADKLASPNDYTAVGVRGAAVAMDQYRWSAARRAPSDFDPATSQKTGTIIPIQINTTLNLGQEGGAELKAEATVWEQHATIMAQAATQEPVQAELVPEGETVQPDTENAQAKLPEALEAVRQQVGLPEYVPAFQAPRKSKGRPKKKHKDLQGTLSTQIAHAKIKNPTVRRALGLPEENPRYEPTDQSFGPSQSADKSVRKRTSGPGSRSGGVFRPHDTEPDEEFDPDTGWKPLDGN